MDEQSPTFQHFVVSKRRSLLTTYTLHDLRICFHCTFFRLLRSSLGMVRTKEGGRVFVRQRLSAQQTSHVCSIGLRSPLSQGVAISNSSQKDAPQVPERCHRHEDEPGGYFPFPRGLAQFFAYYVCTVSRSSSDMGAKRRVTGPTCILG